jgi:hypothetical protein
MSVCAASRRNLVRNAGYRPTNPFGLVFPVIPSSEGEISINGKPVPGGTYPASAGGTGGARLACGETRRRLH